jgi:hypothetical protein
MAQAQQVTNNYNRYLEPFSIYLAQEEKFRKTNPMVSYSDPNLLDHQRMTYENILDRFKKDRNLTEGEKRLRSYIRHGLRRVKAKLKPNLLNRILYNPWINKQFNRLLGRQENFGVYDGMVSLYHRTNAVDANTASLSKELKGIGVKDQLESTLKEWLRQGFKEFAFHVYDFNMPNTDFRVHVKRIPDTSAYTIEKVVTSVYHKPEEVRGSNPSSQSMTFDMDSKARFDTADMATLTMGEPLYRNMGGQDVFVLRSEDAGIGFKKFDFDVRDNLKALPIVGLHDAANMNELIQHLVQNKSSVVYLSGPEGNAEPATLKLMYDKENDRMKIQATDARGIELSHNSPTDELSAAKKVAQKIKAATQKVNKKPTISRSFARVH